MTRHRLESCITILRIPFVISCCVQVSIYIEDVNDSPPVFLHSPYTARLAESGAELPRWVAAVTAQDRDNPPHNQVNRRANKPVG